MADLYSLPTLLLWRVLVYMKYFLCMFCHTDSSLHPTVSLEQHTSKHCSVRGEEVGKWLMDVFLSQMERFGLCEVIWRVALSNFVLWLDLCFISGKSRAECLGENSQDEYLADEETRYSTMFCTWVSGVNVIQYSVSSLHTLSLYCSAVRVDRSSLDQQRQRRRGGVRRTVSAHGELQLRDENLTNRQSFWAISRCYIKRDKIGQECLFSYRGGSGYHISLSWVILNKILNELNEF